MSMIMSPSGTHPPWTELKILLSLNRSQVHCGRSAAEQRGHGTSVQFSSDAQCVNRLRSWPQLPDWKSSSHHGENLDGLSFSPWTKLWKRLYYLHYYPYQISAYPKYQALPYKGSCCCDAAIALPSSAMSAGVRSIPRVSSKYTRNRVG